MARKDLYRGGRGEEQRPFLNLGAQLLGHLPLSTLFAPLPELLLCHLALCVFLSRGLH